MMRFGNLASGHGEFGRQWVKVIHTKQPLLKFFSINIIAAISWPPPLISQLFTQAF